jgi:hypothetical protein
MVKILLSHKKFIVLKTNLTTTTRKKNDTF